jgi:hypothetical protein
MMMGEGGTAILVACPKRSEEIRLKSHGRKRARGELQSDDEGGTDVDKASDRG